MEPRKISELIETGVHLVQENLLRSFVATVTIYVIVSWINGLQKRVFIPFPNKSSNLDQCSACLHIRCYFLSSMDGQISRSARYRGSGQQRIHNGVQYM
jgi:hypothetical protein